MKVDQGSAVLLAASFAIAGIFYTARQNRKALRKQHTYQVLDKMSDWPVFDANYEFARKLLNAGVVPSMCRPEDQDRCEKIDFLLNHYEFVASAIVSGDIDEDLVKRVEEERMPRLFLKLLGYIAENREAISDKIWMNMEHVCYRWTVQDRDLYDRMIERWQMHPSTAFFESNRNEIWAELEKYAPTIK